MLSNQCAWGKSNQEVPSAKDHPGDKRWCWDTQAPHLLTWVLPPQPTFKNPALFFSRALLVIPFHVNRIFCLGCEESAFSKSGELWQLGECLCCASHGPLTLTSPGNTLTASQTLLSKSSPSVVLVTSPLHFSRSYHCQHIQGLLIDYISLLASWWQRRSIIIS